MSPLLFRPLSLCPTRSPPPPSSPGHSLSPPLSPPPPPSPSLRSPPLHSLSLCPSTSLPPPSSPLLSAIFLSAPLSHTPPSLLSQALPLSPSLFSSPSLLSSHCLFLSASVPLSIARGLLSCLQMAYTYSKCPAQASFDTAQALASHQRSQACRAVRLPAVASSGSNPYLLP
ncbi:unnamed protein product [Closterium sp. NIES-65]|nr:unnamed protein product [Closterium sp. NIES-65]